MNQISEIELNMKVEEHQTFENLLVEVSANLISLPVEEIDSIIEKTQKCICQSLDIDFSALWQWDDDHSDLMTITHFHSPVDGPEPAANIDGSTSFPYIYNKMLEGETLAFSNEELPLEAQIDIVSRKHYNVISSVDIPLNVADNPIIGILTFDILYKKRIWTDTEVRRLKIVAEIIANALLRKKNAQALAESEAKILLAVESSQAGFWELDLESNSVWVTNKNREIFNFPTNDQITLAHFKEAIKSEDWERVEQAIKASFQSGENLAIEYRLATNHDKPKWICSRGKPYFNADGSPWRLCGISVDVSERKHMETELKKQYAELQQLKEQVEQENIYLREELISEQGFEHIVGESDTFLKVLKNVKNVSSTPATVLLQGETGTGKGIIANLVHELSDRNNKPLVTVNCAALPLNLIESELFGRAKGAFTGADGNQAGRFEVANNGTIFLDEIGEMSIEIQAKLLRVLQDGEFERLGSSKTLKVDVRVIAATSRNLKKAVEEGIFREDLYYRLNVFPITIPPLRERVSDIDSLAKYFVRKYNKRMRKNIETIPINTLRLMRNYSWPGNVRELEHLIERSIILNEGSCLEINEELFSTSSSKKKPTHNAKDLASNEKQHIIHILELTRWKIEGAEGAAKVLDIHPSTLRFRMKKLNIARPE